LITRDFTTRSPATAGKQRVQDGEKLYIDNARLYTESNGPTHRLVINPVNSDDVGQYTAVSLYYIVGLD